MFVKDPVIYIFDNSDKNPFTAKFDNVKILDNTKGQIINFDEWLKKYPNREKSPGRVNKWGSAKHCYSVEKGMELINDNFILLDSDVLLKRDISNLIINDAVYTGEVITQPASTVKRVLPFICFINTNLCKEKGIHYFDANYMHGLYVKPGSDRYDTGGGFYMNSEKYKHVDIKCSDYLIHYGHGSWKKIGVTQKYNPAEWLEANKKYWSNEKNKKVVYTCITGCYDALIEPKVISSGFDYICFTDNNDLKSDIWQIKPLPKEAEEFSNVKKQRFAKINPHIILKEYDLSIWVDGNVDLQGDLNTFLSKYINDDEIIYVPTHPARKCIYDEEKAVITLKKDKKEITRPQITRYMEEGFPKKYGLLQSNILVRRHNNPMCIKLMETWFEEVKNGSHRDQLSFNYASWKNQDVKVNYLDKSICKSEWFLWHGVHKRFKKPVNVNHIVTKKPLKRDINEILERIKNKRLAKKVDTQNIGIYRV